MPPTDRAIINLKPNAKQSKRFDVGGLHLVVYSTASRTRKIGTLAIAQGGEEA